MTPYERVMSALTDGKVDRVPVIPIVREWCAYQAGYNIIDMMTNVDMYVFSQFYCQKRFNFDAVWDLGGVHAESEAMGSKIKYSATMPPSMIEPIVNNYPVDLYRLKIPDPWKDGRMPLILNGIIKLKELSKGKVPVIGYIQAPFRHASMLRGPENIMRDLFTNISNLEKLMEIATQSQLVYGKALIKAGADIIFIADPTSSGDVISKKQWEKWGLPYTKILVKFLKETGDVKTILHICGNTQDRLLTFKELEIDGISLDEKVNLDFARKVLGDKVCLMGNVSPSKTLFQGTPGDVEYESRKCIELAGNESKFILSSGCLVPGDVCADNMKAMVAVASK